MVYIGGNEGSMQSKGCAFSTPMSFDGLRSVSEENDPEKRVELVRKILPSVQDLFEFGDVDRSVLKNAWSGCFQCLERCPSQAVTILDFLRILSRDKTHQDAIFDENPSFIGKLLKLARLQNVRGEEIPENDIPVIEAALRCLGNVAKQSKVGLEASSSEDTIRRLVMRLGTSTPITVTSLDMRILFLATALKPHLREFVRSDCQGLMTLGKVLQLAVERGEALGTQLGPREAIGSLDVSQDQPCVLDKNASALVCDVLKVLYNLSQTSEGVEEDIVAVDRIAVTIRRLLLSSPKENALTKQQLVANIVNLFTAVPSFCFSKLIELPEPNPAEQSSKPEDNEEAMKPIAVVLAYLDVLLNSLDEGHNVPQAFQSLFPALIGLSRMAKANGVIRRYMRREVLPKLNKSDLMKRPEEGNTLRNKLVRLLTHPSMELRDAAATFLFVLCKENVGRMVRYTGFGNAAGMLSTRGLLGAMRSENAEYYSDTASGSESEDYQELAPSINPVSGCYEPPCPDPMEGMTDEQKEYEAIRLVNLIDRLNRHGCIQPARVGPGGRVEPIGHVMEMLEGVDPSKFRQRGEPEGSDNE